MKSLKNHIILSLIALFSTNMYFVLWLLIDKSVSGTQIMNELSFFQFMGITNGALIVISMFSITYKNLGDRMLAWGHSNVFRFVFLVLLSILIFVLANVLLFSVHFAIRGVNGLTASVTDAIGNTYFLPLVFFFSLVSILMFFISNLERRSGSVFRLFAQSMGNSLKPKLVERGFMFVDLNDATSLAEELGSEKYAQLLRDCFRLLSELVEFSPFQIYQFVGDEAVLTWTANTPNADILAIKLFTDFKAYLEENNYAFAKAYAIQPKFKCAIHSGEVVQSEIGREAKHLVYHGDVLNTTSRLLSQCHKQHTDIIISETALNNKKNITEKYILKVMQYAQLKGKKETVNAFAVTEKLEIIHEDFFLTKKVTDSHKSILNTKAMRTIKNAMLTILFAGLFTSCGDQETKGPQANQEKEGQQTQQTSASTTSNLQVVKLSDLELKTIKNTTVQNHLPITGRVVPKNTTQLVAEVQGRILTSNKSFKAGTSYRKGEVIMRIDSREFALNLESQKSAFLNILTGMMPDLKADYPDNYQAWLTYVNNYQTGKPLPALPTTKTNPEKYFVTSQQVYNTYYNIKAQEERLSKFTLRAPFTGSLSVAMVDNGGLVSPGQQLGTFISDNNFEIESAVNLRMAQALKVGQKVDFTNKELGKTFTATVTRINNIVDPSTQNIPVYLKITDSDLRSGMYLEGQVVSNAFENAITIPVTAVNRDNTVHILSNDVIKKAPIEVVDTTDDQVVVRGLKENTQLVLTTFDNPVSGLKITQ